MRPSLVWCMPIVSLARTVMFAPDGIRSTGCAGTVRAKPRNNAGTDTRALYTDSPRRYQCKWLANRGTQTESVTGGQFGRAGILTRRSADATTLRGHFRICIPCLEAGFLSPEVAPEEVSRTLRKTSELGRDQLHVPAIAAGVDTRKLGGSDTRGVSVLRQGAPADHPHS